jgi:hypothetical protein
MASINLDSHAVWPFPVRHDGSCRLIATLQNLPVRNSNATSSFRTDHAPEKIMQM